MEYFVARKIADTISQQKFEVSQALAAWKTHPLTSEVRDFLLLMITSSAPLWELIEATRDKALVDVGYAGGNAITMLRLMGESLEQAQLASTVLLGADLFNANLANTDFSGSCLREANLSGSILKGADLRGADLTGSDMSEIVEIRSVACSPLGHDIACGCDDGSVRIWSVGDDEMIALRGGHKYYVRSVCFRPPAGEQVASSSVDGSVVIWDLNSRSLIAKFELPPNTVHRLAFDPSGQVLAYGGLSGTVEPRKAPDWSLRTLLEGHQSYVSTVCFSPNGKLLASGSYDGMILLWDVSEFVKISVYADRCSTGRFA